MYLLAGSLSYLIGAIVVTIACNVPLNNALAALDPKSSDALLFWPRYVRQWTAWNHVRTVSGLLAAGVSPARREPQLVSAWISHLPWNDRQRTRHRA